LRRPMFASTSAASLWSTSDDINMRVTHVRSVRAEYKTITSGPYGKSTKMLVGHHPTLANKPVLVKVEYARPMNIAAAVSNSGYKPVFDRLKGRLEAELGSSVRIVGGPGRSASFEIYADGELLHSKLGGSRGKLDTEGVPVWTNAECKALVAKLKPLIRA